MANLRTNVARPRRLISSTSIGDSTSIERLLRTCPRFRGCITVPCPAVRMRAPMQACDSLKGSSVVLFRTHTRRFPLKPPPGLGGRSHAILGLRANLQAESQVVPTLRLRISRIASVILWENARSTGRAIRTAIRRLLDNRVFLSIRAHETAHFNSRDLEEDNPSKRWGCLKEPSPPVADKSVESRLSRRRTEGSSCA